MNAPQTIARGTVVAALDALGIKFEDARDVAVVHIAGDHISLEKLTGEGVYWRRIVDECASCHAPEGRPHTEYCQLPDPWTAPLDGIQVRPACTRPADDLGDGRGCQHEGCPLHSDPALENEPDTVDLVGALRSAVDRAREHRQADALAEIQVVDLAGEPAPWVDNGCRCPNPDQHMPGCPAVTVRTCRSCGCTEDAACECGCSWVETDLCSACLP